MTNRENPVDALLGEELDRLANNVKKKRGTKGLTQSDLAYHSRCSQRAISMIETRSGKINLYSIAKLCRYFDCSFKEIFS